MPDETVHPLRSALSKFWTPVPWMLEAAIVLELALGKYVEAAVIAALLVFNAGGKDGVVRMVRDPLRPQVVPQPGHLRDPGRHA